MKKIEDIVKSDLCIGCGICLMAIKDENAKMILNEDGFFEPRLLNDSKKKYKDIKNICPGINLVNYHNEKLSKVEKLWGKIEKSYIGYATDDEIRFKSSSGGAISALLLYLVESKKVDYVVHLKPDIKSPLKFVLQKSKSRDEILTGAGSRYAPSSIFTNIDKIIENSDSKIAIVGKPCEIAGLRNFINLNEKYKANFIAFISFFCAGIPSINATYRLLDELGVAMNDLKSFKYRGDGWPGKVVAEDINGKKYEMSYNDSWGKILNKHLHFRCKICPDGVGKSADIVCGDAWYSKDGYPDFEERKGRSVIISRNETGKKLLNEAFSLSYINIENLDLNDLDIIQSYQKKRIEYIFPRILAMRFFLNLYPKYTGYYLFTNFLHNKGKYFFRNFIGTVKRIIKRKIIVKKLILFIKS